MSLLLATALVAAPATLPACSWDRPGLNVFMGDVVASVDRYADIPAAVRGRLKQRMAARQYDEMATITRDAITGKARYAPDLREMHFGNGTVCRTVSRSGWTDRMVERGLVYCEGEHCLIVPTVCRNLSRITRLDDPQKVASDAAMDMPGLTPSGTPIDPVRQAQATGMEVPEGELAFEPPGAGVPGAPPGSSFAELSSIPPIAGPGTTPIDGSSQPAPNILGPTPGTPDTVAGPAANTPGPLADGPVVWPPDALPIGGGSAPIGILPRPEDVAVIPEPPPWALWLAGGVAVLALARRRRGQHPDPG